MDKNKDILESSIELKKMPFEIPKGYMETFKSEAKIHKQPEKGIFTKLSPLLTMAAMFLAIVTVGNLVMKNADQPESYTFEDYIVHSDINVSAESYDMYNSQVAEANLTQEDIVKYLIYIGASAENIKENIKE